MSKTLPKPQTELPSRPDLSRGMGAVSAGPATFARTLPRVQVPVAKTQPAAPKPAPAPVASVTKTHTVPAPTYGMLYLFKRVLAYSLDTAVNLALLCVGLMLALWNQEVRPEVLMNPSLLILAVLFCLLFNWALITAQEITFSTSIGKRAFGLALRGDTGSIFLRAFFFIPSLLFCGIGLAWSIFDGQRRCWHDIVVGIQPVEIARL